MFVSVSQRYGSEDPHPNPYQNVTDPQLCFKPGKLYFGPCSPSLIRDQAVLFKFLKIHAMFQSCPLSFMPVFYDGEKGFVK
jgi:hypothetical protein